MGQNQSENIGVHREYDRLERVVLCKPEFMHIDEAINEIQAHYIEENIDKKVALKQHKDLVEKLEELGVEVSLLPTNGEFPEQVFTRDIGFTLGETLFIAKLQKEIRQGEEEILMRWLKKQELPYHNFEAGTIEGGDVLIDGDTIFIGDSLRTGVKAITELQKKLPNYNVELIPFDGQYLHLDCVFNIVSKDEALIYPPAFDEQTVKAFAKRYKLIEVSKEEQFTLGTNVLVLGEGRIISLPRNKHVNQKLRDHGFTVIEVDISEIIKSGGAFRCITMPMLRSN
ncbi:dimethylarginine dimethylaminohydrolase family protein [Desertibacillus haloalkaliphilus]|uniref:dimethylarginine dimethylaminohydrolase family protein n=1 Tax=Desertibacillus haloalkaliphilus TaxID=1328930 RepID=UPI001FE9C51B|nr:dimethylarginine dimethylaminohydrolase family protein [Desertibacillus haloalkaliphilus]